MKEKQKESKGIEYYVQLPYSILLHQVNEEGDKYWIAEVTELPGCKSHGSTVNEAVDNAKAALKDWILDSLERGEEVPIPVERDSYSGKILVRMSRSLHHSLSIMADSEKLSLNQLIVTILGKEVGRFDVLNNVEDKVNLLLDRLNELFDVERQSLISKAVTKILDSYPRHRAYMQIPTGHLVEASTGDDISFQTSDPLNPNIYYKSLYGSIIELQSNIQNIDTSCNEEELNKMDLVDTKK